MKKNTGITLIALIITIIVMLILVGVSISVALRGGLFERAERARDATRIEAEKERLLEIAMGALDDTTVKVNREQLESNLPSGWTMDPGGPPYICTSPNGNRFRVNENGTVEYISSINSTTNIDSATGIGQTKHKITWNLEHIKTDGLPTEIRDGENLIVQFETEEGYYLPLYDVKGTINGQEDYWSCNGEGLFQYYNVYSDLTISYTATTNKLGRYVDYRGILWRVLYDDTTNGVQLLSANAMTGSTELNANNNINLYNSLLVDECKIATGITDLTIRNVGGPPSDEASFMKISDLNTFSPTTESGAAYFDGNTIKNANADDYYTSDCAQMDALNITYPDNGGYYKLSYRTITETGSHTISFGSKHYFPVIRTIGEFGIFSITSNGNINFTIGYPINVRPVLMLGSGSLDNAQGKGTKNDPMTIN